MSQEPPKPPQPSDSQPEPQPPESQPPTPRPETGQTGSSFQQVTQTLQQSWSRVQPVLKTQTVKALRGTINTLEGVVEKLEAEPPSPESATSTEQRQPQIQAPNLEQLRQQLRPALQRLQEWWQIALTQIRARLPEAWNQKLSNTALTGAIAGIAVVLLWTTSALFSSKPVEVAKSRPTPEVLQPQITAPPELTAPEEPQPIEVAPPLEVTPPAEIAPPPDITPPSEVAPPAEPLPIPTPIPTPAPAPSPLLELTPEQQLIAAIQDQVADVTNQYASGLIQSVQANFQGSRLIVKVSEDWYPLSESQQDKLANEMLRRAQELDFNKLEITDPTGDLLARSPVVGSNMVILKRHQAIVAG